MNRITILSDRCRGCGLCVEFCPKKILTISGKTLNAQGYHPAEVTDMTKCIACAMCAMMCPHVVIRVERDVDKPDDAGSASVKTDAHESASGKPDARYIEADIDGGFDMPDDPEGDIDGHGGDSEV